LQPKFPGWFAPAARFAEQRPRGALVSLILTWALTFGAGLVLGWVLK
jgi:hypothetical protein